MLKWLLKKLFENFTITDLKGDPYLTRYKLLKSTGWCPIGIYIHEIHQGDSDRHLHDHPWDFTSLILAGGYHEETPLFNTNFGPLSIIRHKAADCHRLTLTKKTWTLVFKGKAYREWGFVTENGWVHNEAYLKEKYKDIKDFQLVMED
jgi:hypothetical protein